MKKSVVIHQPEFFPWVNLFNKILYADTFVFLDDVQYNRRGFQNRNQILLFGSPSWLTVPLNKSKRSELINNIEIDNTQSWNSSIKSKIVQAYSKSKYFHEVMPIVDDILDREYTLLSDLNCYSIVRILFKFPFSFFFKPIFNNFWVCFSEWANLCHIYLTIS